MSPTQSLVEQHINIPSPKQKPRDLVGRACLYPYYAGYSLQFAKACIQRYLVNEAGAVLDPWNGGGTTTQAAVDAGIRCFGLDVNPIPLCAARARLVSDDHLKDVVAFFSLVEGIDCSRFSLHDTDPLGIWLKPSATSAFRSIERMISSYFSLSVAKPLLDEPAPCFCLTVLSRVLRNILQPRSSSNPTWAKRPKTKSERVGAKPSQILSMFSRFGTTLINSIANEPLPSNVVAQQCSLSIGNSMNIRLPDSSIDLILTSPPYCTRIDYAVASAPDLALIGLDQEDGLRDLRDRTTGTSTIRNETPSPHDSWGATCCNFLSSMESHASKASKSYYLKNHLQYFHDLSRSVAECARVLKAGGRSVVVVQDSYYKDLHNDLPQILIEMMQMSGLTICERNDFPVSRNMASVNSGAAKYKATRENTESVLVFER